MPPEIGLLRNLENFNYSNNPIEYIPPNILNFLNRQTAKQGIYSDKQSVHNHKIKECITKSINYILSIKPTIKNLNQEIINNEILTQNTKEILFEYLQNAEIHSVLNITFQDLFLNVFSIILNDPHKDEILKVLNLEMQDSMCKCMTGRISRLVNVLNGFDENIKIEIGENEQIGNIILVIKNKLNPYDLEVHKNLVKQELEERGYGMDTIEEWLNYIE